MPTNVIMPALGMDQETGTLVRWLKQEGERVAKGEPLMEIETDKAVVEVESPGAGILSHVTAHEDDEVPVGQIIALLLDPGEVSPEVANTGAPAPGPRDTLSPESRVSGSGPGVGTVRARSTAKEQQGAQSSVPSSGSAQALSPQPFRRLASPRARRLAAERGIDLAAVQGTGPEGAVLAGDVSTASSPSALHAPPAGVLPSSRAWRVMAERMAASWSAAPHFYLVREVVAGGLVEMRGRIAPAVERRSGVRPTYTDLLVKLLATALRNHPRVNVVWDGDRLREGTDVNVAIAIATDDALVAPVIRSADALSVGDIAVRRQELVDRAGAGKLTPSDLSEGTFTLTNLGMYGVDAFNAIINPPQTAILAVGRIADRVVAVEGQPVVRPTLVLTLSCDHRAIDGARAAPFLDELAGLIEEPYGLLA